MLSVADGQRRFRIARFLRTRGIQRLVLGQRRAATECTDQAEQLGAMIVGFTAIQRQLPAHHPVAAR
ncbi:hypothetical protein [Luteibacter jiangsuensis]|uniref:hypothetical protein n=1 Tax=Luteibacter jiangsuensis TaxID=637577 RepID=UPI0027D8894E|nr:hypothetical protein [Luteibacter jiangsuensis]